MKDFSVKFKYIPTNPVLTICQMISAPPLDILKRAAEAGVKHRRKVATHQQKVASSDSTASLNVVNTGIVTNSVNYRNSRYWICLHQLKLYFYQYYGDAVPRLVSDVKDANVTVMRDKGRVTSLVNLTHSDSRSWVLEFGSKQEAVRFEVALMESKKAYYEGKSMYAKREELLENFNFGFNLVMC
jgi:hypothetical protein